MFKYLGELRIVLIYFVFATAWILFSDSILGFIVRDIKTLSMIQTYKGLFFIALTSVFLFYLIKMHTAQLYKVQKELKNTKQRLEFVIQGANLGYWDWNYKTGQLITNDIWLHFIGLDRKDVNDNIVDWEKRVHPDDIQLTQNALKQTISDNLPFVIEYRMRHKKGHWVWIEGSGTVVSRDKKSGEPLRLAGTQQDITNRKKSDEKISFLAMNDTLTNLPNRFFLKNKLEEWTLGNKEFAFLFLDLDYFKNINDLYGHSEGDKVIREVAIRFKNAMDHSDFIARVGGDEFVILKKNIANLEDQCRRLVQSMEKPFTTKGIKSKISVSIGVSLFLKDGENFEDLFKNADTAMYVAKNSGKNRCQMYHKEMTEEIEESTKMDNDLQKAIENDEFVVYFQPQITLVTQKIIGVEALVRWKHPNIGLVFPDKFIKIAEENRAIIEIGIIVFKKSLEQLIRWKKAKLFDGRIAINISAIQLEEENFVAIVEHICKDMLVTPFEIELEITESYIMKNPKKSIKTLQNLADLGFHISIDDFGTGYSSLSYLKQLPVHKLKIDRSFVKDLPEDKEDQAISKTIIALAKNLELEVLAEGVETIEQHKFLEENLCDSAQGYLFSKPIDSESFYMYLQSKDR